MRKLQSMKRMYMRSSARTSLTQMNIYAQRYTHTHRDILSNECAHALVEHIHLLKGNTEIALFNLKSYIFFTKRISRSDIIALNSSNCFLFHFILYFFRCLSSFPILHLFHTHFRFHVRLFVHRYGRLTALLLLLLLCMCIQLSLSIIQISQAVVLVLRCTFYLFALLQC